MSSPISQSLFDTMKISVLKRVDELLFSSSKPRSITKVVRKVNDLSPTKNLEIFNAMVVAINDFDVPNLSIYRISLFLFCEWIEGEELKFLTPIFKDRFFGDLREIVNDFGLYAYLCNISLEMDYDPFLYSLNKDFREEDVESYQETFEVLSELEHKRIEVFKDFLI